MRYIYVLIALAAASGAAIFLFADWRQKHNQMADQTLNSYHLNTIYHAANLKNILFQIGKTISNQEIDKDVFGMINPTLGLEELLPSIQRQVGHIAELQEKYGSIELSPAVAELEESFAKFRNRVLEMKDVNQESSIKVKESFDQFLIELKQLERLHSIKRQKFASEMVTVKETYSSIFYTALLSILLIAGILTSLLMDGIRRVFEKQEESQKLLLQSEEMNRLIMNSVPVLIAYVDCDGRYLFTNREYAEWFSARPDHIQGKLISEVAGEKIFINIKGHMEKAFTGQEVNFQSILSHPAKGQRNIDIKYTPDFGLDGKVKGLFTTISDITDLKQTEQELLKISRTMELILKSTVAGIYGLDSNGNTTFCNLAGAKMVGYEIEELIGKTQHDILHHSKPDGSPYPREECPIFATIRHGNTHQVSNEVFWRKDGTSFPVEYLSAPIKESGKVVGAVVTFQDITQRKLIEQELDEYRNQLENLVEKKTGQLEKTHQLLLHSEKLSAVGRLSASIAHEFNNPLYGIQNVLEEVRDGVKLNSGYEDLVNIGIKECRRMADLIRKLNVFHCPSSGVSAFIDVNHAIDEIIVLVRKKLRERRIELKLNYANSLPMIPVVLDQFKQVILNVIQNAEHSIPQQGGQISVATEISNSFVKIHIQDTGRGIEAGNMKNIFEPFFTTKAEVKGTGLGLFISRGIIQAHGGDITVDSVPGKGTAVTLTLPIKEKGKEHEA